MGGDGTSDEVRPKWVDIQLHTFKNWINEQEAYLWKAHRAVFAVESVFANPPTRASRRPPLPVEKPSEPIDCGRPFRRHKSATLQLNAIGDLTRDLSDGVNLIRLVEILQGRKYYGKIYDQNPTEIQKLMNVQMALDALREDRVKTVNIGSHDIVDGNEKLVLGLMWCLVQRYQIACKTKIPPKKLVMAWIQSVLPELKLTNFRTNWNDGKALSALLEYCQPGLCPEWKRLDHTKSLENCERALLLAERYLDIPRIISAAHLSSPHLDELSCLTYLSYFITKGAPGYRATLQRVQLLVPDCTVDDFEHSWSDGYLLALLVDACGGNIPEMDQMHFETFQDFVENVSLCIEAAADIGVGSLVGAEDIADPQGEHLGTMAFVAALCSTTPQPDFKSTQCFIHQQVNLDLAFSDGNEVRVDELDVRVIGPTGRVHSHDTLRLHKSRTVQGAVLSLIPAEQGYHQVRIFCQGSELPSSPISLHVLTQEESRAASRATSRAFAENRIVAQPPSPPKSVQRTESGSEVDISHQPFAQRRLHIIKQLEAQTLSQVQAKKEQSSFTSSPSTVPQQTTGNNTRDWNSQEKLSQKSPYGGNIPPPPPAPELVHHVSVLEASAHREMPLSRTSDVGLVSFSGLSEPCSVGSIVEVVINAHGDVVNGAVYVESMSPSGRAHPCTVNQHGQSYMATFTPMEVGLWRIGILYEGEHIRGSPFACQVFDSNLVNVYGLDVGLVGQELRFTVNASQGGHGDLKVSVLRHGREIQSTVEEQGNSGVYRVTFVPDGAGQYKIHVLFNKMEIKGSPFILDIADASSVSVYGENLRTASVGRLASFMVHAVGADVKDIGAHITAPSGKEFSAHVFALDDVTFQVEWTPREPGEHAVDVLLADQRVVDSPFGCNVGAPELVRVLNIPRRIQPSALNEDQFFEIDASSAGSGNLEIMINGGRVPCRVRELGSRQYQAIFTPTQSITHTIEMRFNGEHVSGSPWKVPVEERGERRQDMERAMSYYSELSGPGLVRAPINRTATFDVTGEGLDLSDIQAKIFGPDGREFPIRVVPRSNGRFTAEYRIEQVGEHQLTVWIAGRKVDGSPLSVAGYATEKVRLEPLGGGAPQQPVQFIVDAVDAGKGQLEISVNQGRVPNNVQMQGAGRCLVTFIPQHPGTYVIDVTFNGEQVHGCPIKVEILPKQVGQQVHANLTPTAVSTAVSAGGASIAGAFRSSRSPASSTSPTSPTLLQHARQRSEETTLRSPTLLRESRKTEKPWQTSYAPTPNRNAFSQSPHRDWSASSVYDRVYGSSNEVDRSMPNETSRSHNIREITTVIRRTPSPSGIRSRQITETITRTAHRSPSPPHGSVRTQEFADRLGRSPSPTRRERDYLDRTANYRLKITFHSSFPTVLLKGHLLLHVPLVRLDLTSVRLQTRPSADPTLLTMEKGSEKWREWTRWRMKKTESVNGRSNAKMIATLWDTPWPNTDNLDTLRERLLKDAISEIPWKNASVLPPHCIAPSRRNIQRSTRSTSEKEPEVPRRASPERPPKVEGNIAASYKSFEPVYTEVTTTRTTTTTGPTPPVEYENVDRRPERPRRVPTPEGHMEDVKDEEPRHGQSAHHVSISKPKRDDSPAFTRTQSEQLLDKEKESASEVNHLHRSEEREAIYDIPPTEALHRSAEIAPQPLTNEEKRNAEYLRVKEEDERIFTKHGLRGKKQEPSIDIQEPLTEPIRDDVVETVHEGPEETLRPIGELPHSPAPSAPTTPAVTPKVSMKFKKDGKETKPFDFGKSKFSTKHEVVKFGKEVEVKLDSLKLGKEDLLRVVVVLNKPQSAVTGVPPPEIEAKVKKSGSKYEIVFKPAEVGTYKVFAYVNEVQHPLSPFVVRVYDSSEIVVGEIPTRSHLNDTVEFTVDAGRAGFGNLEMAIKDAGGVIIPSHVAQLESGSAKFLVTFSPITKGTHTVNITFNKEVLKNSPFEVNIVDPPTPPVAVEGLASPSLSKKDLKKEEKEKKKGEKERARREKEERAATLKREKKSKHKFVSKTAVSKIPSLSRVGQPSSLVVEVAGHDQLEIVVTDSKKNQIGTEIVEIEPGSMQINFTPQNVGDHEIEVKYGGAPVTGSPFTCRAYDPAKIKVGAIPKGLLDKPVYFTVDASEAGVGNLEVAVCEGRVPSMAHALGQHKYDISFVPKENVDHTITVRFNNEPVPGSPFICHLVASAQATASGLGLERIPVDEETEIKIQTDDNDSRPEVRVRDPQSNDLPVNVTRSKSDETLHIATYTPKCVGNHQIDISLGGEPIAGSPFTAKAYDARKAILTPPETAVAGKPATFIIDAARAGAGNMEIIVSVDNRNVPNFVQAEGQARFKVSFTPQEPKEHIISVRFNGISVPGSPLKCPVSPAVAAAPAHQHVAAPLGAAAVTAAATVLQKSPEIPEPVAKTGLAREVQSAQVGQKRGFTIDNINRSTDCNVVITAPDGGQLPVNIDKSSSSVYTEFTPTVKGEHTVRVFMDGEKFDEFVVKVKEERASLPPVSLVGLKYSFDVDADDKNEVRVVVRDPSGRQLPVLMEDLPDGGVRVTCRFKEIGPHSIDTFVDERPFGERRFQTVIDPMNGAQLVSEPKREIVGQTVEHKILIDSGIESQVAVEIEGPDREVVDVQLKKISETLYAAVWTPRVEGEHNLTIMVAGMKIPGSPFPIHVLDPSAVRVIGLRNDRIGAEQQFNVDYSNSGAASASVEVSAGGRPIPVTVKKVKPGLLVCTFTPHTSGNHQVDVTIDGQVLPECPYECYISHIGSVRASGDALKRAQRARTARFEIMNCEQNRGELDVMVSDPKGGPLPVRCYKQQDDSYWVEFTPEHLGTHTIEVTFGDVPVPGSPFRCEVIDPKRVEVKGLNDTVLLRHATTINVDRREAGLGELQVEVVDPTGNPLRVEALKSPGGEDRITFLPNTTGPHKVNVKMGGFQIPGYPQTVMVSEMEKPGVYGAAIDQSIKINEPASFIFDPKKANGGLKINVIGPDQTKIRHNVMRRANGTSEVVFYPEDVGSYNVSIDFNNKPVTGSPFTVKVVDPSKVIVNDLDMDRDGSLLLRLGHSNSFDVDATAAGPGKLRAEVRDADSALVGEGPAVDDLGQGKHRVRFSPTQPGRYSIYLYWNELPVESAFPVRARSSAEDLPTTSREVHETSVPLATHIREKSSTSAPEDDLNRVMVRGDGLHRAALKQHNEFIIDGSDISREGRITATLLGTKADIPVRIQQLGHNVFKATYTPLTGGTYELHVLWNGKHVKGSPFRVTADTSAHPADLIGVDSTSLKIGIINENIKTVIDTRRAGPGQLSAHCMGPVKPAYCELYDHRDGTYTLCVRPAEVGKHTLVIKYNDEHVHGSPFLVHVSLPPDPSKVRVYGPGVEHGILSLFKSNFVVETRGAGAGQLTVRVRGPKGAFNVEMQREKKNERTIHCKYEPKEPGDYQVEVKWHGEHVPGSPFLVMIVDTEQELSRFLRGEAPSPTPATPFIPPGWVGPPPMFHHLPPGQRPHGPPMGPAYGAPLVPYGAPPPPKHKSRHH
ncbi:unnamed protein product [Caenorhabditis auriculariae]|uniref:Calponin-homology (CH) domain-containing protein n=1 Tax=Caenorhabditis auriculariae TaxID=2777116 RepID=A0A8S1H088_9PELO|nr:unnamed protein product [Caenorhabditis auriculariae]